MLMKKIISSLLLLSLFLSFNGCIPKQGDGKYHSQYSYHPYFKMYNNNIIATKRYSPATKQTYYHRQEPIYSAKDELSNYNTYQRTYKTQRTEVPKKSFKRVIKRVKYNDEDNYPSNVPAGGY